MLVAHSLVEKSALCRDAANPVLRMRRSPEARYNNTAFNAAMQREFPAGVPIEMRIHSAN